MKKIFYTAAIILMGLASCNKPNIPTNPTGSNDTTDTVPQDTVPIDTVVHQLSDVETDYSPRIPSGLPILRINTSGQAIVSTEHWIENNVSYQLFNENNTLIINGATDIKGRGNSTWGMPKKPYSLKLKSKKEILGMPEHKRWALLANYADKTLLRTEIGYKLGYIFDNLAWTPHAKQVNFYLNDEYRGVYQISEAIKIDENRVDISEISTSSPNGGFLVECDWRRGEDYNFQSEQPSATHIWYNCSDPDDGLDAVIPSTNKTVFKTIKDKILSVENIVYSNSSFNSKAAVIDINSFIDFYFVQEIVKNVDAQFGLSVFLYYNPQTQKIHLGPIWDFDYACGNANYSEAKYETGFYMKDAPYYNQLFNYSNFKTLVKARWAEKKSEVLAIFDFIDQRAAELDEAQWQNFRKWTILDKNTGTNYWVTGTYAGEIERTKDWLQQRINWLDTQITNLR